MNLRKKVEQMQLKASQLVGGTSAGRKIHAMFDELLNDLTPEAKQAAADESLDELKEKYEEVIGKKPGRRTAQTMRDEIAAAS